MAWFKSAEKNSTKMACASVLADFFQVDELLAAAWCAEKEEGLNITLPFAATSLHKDLLQAFASAGVNLKQLELNTYIQAKVCKHKRLPTVKNMLAVASGKGGVGKSTTSVNLAFALMQEGASVGLLDADIYGPSIPIMLGNPDDHPASEDQRHMFPLQAHGLVANSIGYLLPAENAAIWRGPMVSRALQQLVNETLWPELDYLIVDMPPGTGDIQLTLAQQVPVTAAIVVTTPQDLALADATKGVAMFNKVDIPVLGVVENMSYYQCSECGHKAHLFASGGGYKLAQEQGIDLLGQLPLDIHIRQHADGGEPLLFAQPDNPLSETYRQTARTLSMKLALSEHIPADNNIPVVQSR